ncbi:MAG: cupin domain-containing protein [Burkholderiales bacterium]|nr:cupin domain-containing protein [Burkholderiales bacterium]
MSVHLPSPLLGGLSPRAFMRRFWQRRPLLVRQAWPGVRPPLPRAGLLALAAAEGVESRLVQREGGSGGDPDTPGTPGTWRVRHGPFARRALPPLDRPGWTLLVQGLDLHVRAAHEMLAPFRFVPAARLDDLMISWASPGGGVGPHADAYDVFLLQVQGRRRWRVAPPAAPGESGLVEGLPLKILRRFEPVHDWVLEPGDLLYLPPRWGHDGVAVGGDCMTCSVGFRTPSAPELARELLQRLADEAGDEAQEGTAAIYADATQPATATPGLVPAALQRFAARAVAQVLRDPAALPRTLGETLSEPKPRVWFEAGGALPRVAAVRLDARTRMLYDERHVFINGESYRAGGRDARLLRRLADGRTLAAADVSQLGADALGCLQQWAEAGWLHAEADAVVVEAKEARR